MAGYTRVGGDEVRWSERRSGGAASRDLSGALGATTMTLRTWRFGPGHQMAYHRHREQDEIYHLISGGPQEVLIDGEVVVVVDGDWLLLPRETPRRIQNGSDREAVWLTMGAPPGEGITDGVRLDPETGQEIARA